jgi:hypothetical protein
MSTTALKKTLLTIAIVVLAAVALAGTAVAVAALAGGFKESYKDLSAPVAAVSVSHVDTGASGRGYYRSSGIDPYSTFDGLE